MFNTEDSFFKILLKIAPIFFIMTTGCYLTYSLLESFDKHISSKRYDITITNLNSKEKIIYTNAGLSTNWNNFTVDDNGQKITYSYEGNSLSYQKLQN